MPETTATEAPTPEAFRAAFLAEVDKEPVTTADDPTEPVTDGAAATDEPATDDDAGTDDPEDDDAGAAALPPELGALKAAIDSDDPAALIAALGDKAETLLGATAHKALRHKEKELKAASAKLVRAGEELQAKFGDPATIRAAAAKGDADAVVEGVEKFFGASWADLIKFVNASFSGKPARLEAKAAEQRAATERSNAERTAAESRVRESIKAEVGKSAPALATAYPALTELVFAKMRERFREGIDTPAKALKLVRADLAAQHKALSGAFSKPEASPEADSERPRVRPPRETGAKGRPMTPEEFRQDFISSFARDERAKSKRGAK